MSVLSVVVVQLLVSPIGVQYVTVRSDDNGCMLCYRAPAGDTVCDCDDTVVVCPLRRGCKCDVE